MGILLHCARNGPSLYRFSYNKIVLNQKPVLRKVPAENPVEKSPDSEFLYQVEFGLNTACILEPYNMVSALLIYIIEEGCLGVCIIFNVSVIP